MKIIENEFHGIEICNIEKEITLESFSKNLIEEINLWEKKDKKLIWLTLPINQSKYIHCATALGFVFHNCHETEITLIKRLTPNAYAPFAPTHTVGVGGMVINANKEILVIRERNSVYKGYKLPGGILEAGETIRQGVIREIKEETGVDSEFRSVSGFLAGYPYKFNNANIYVVCKLSALTNEIAIQDTEEVLEAKWVSMDDFIQDEINSPLNRKIIEQAYTNPGLNNITFDMSLSRSNVKEIFI
ncbi:NUDIX hydrolase [Teredinibacter sp. KSP-S5-2]|uniref:NUDIX hydrolase n=1 Tax=Teredinibacter sp. KSP-S5-2 TaxID=3034506 RepID=UPI002934BF75|nr:NUDIX domain-containing protein [Teredinibacter sp. KSP-S5-2]WNO08812.1 NUDIX domain-containing protein [Teredinibacter sp. KSP-S5-2]